VSHPQKRPDIGFIPTPNDAITAMLKLANLTAEDHVYDLGCGDGRLLIQAAIEYGITGVGVDLDEKLLEIARTKAAVAGVNHHLAFLQGDLFDSGVSDATVVFLYLLPHLNLKLRPRLLQQLKPGTRIISHQFDMGDWPPDLTLKLEPSEEDSVLFLWHVPDVVSHQWTKPT
jgi:SAM-dependent methyltransferase